MTEHVSSLGGFSAAPGDFYTTAAPAFPGVASATGFQVAALFLPAAELDALETLWSNQGVLAGWRLAIQPSAVVTNPPNAVDVILAVNGATLATATLVSVHPGVPILAHAHVYDEGGTLTADLYINGVLAASGVGAPLAVYAPSAGTPFVGIEAAGGAEPAINTRVLGVMYHEGAAPAGASPASYYLAAREAGTLASGTDTTTATYGNQYTVQRGLSGRGIVPTGTNGPLPPTAWAPDAGLVSLARTGTALTVRGHKNLDWHAAMFATLAVP